MNPVDTATNRVVFDASGRIGSGSEDMTALDLRFGAAGSIPVFRLAPGTLVAKRNSLGTVYAPGLGTGGTISAERLFFPSDLSALILSERPNESTSLPLLEAVFLDRRVGTVLDGEA